MTDTESRIDPTDKREFEEALGRANGTAEDAAASPDQAVPDFPTRLLAAVIDGAIAGAVGFVPLVGGLAGTAYILCRDGLAFEFADGRSVGKKVMGLRPVRLDGKAMDIPTSVKRNWMFGFGAALQVLLFIPIIGWLLMIPVGLLGMGLGLLELYKVLTDPQQRRFGDHWAGTRVISEKQM